MTAPPALLILGFGRFGRALAELAHDAGVAVRACDPSTSVPLVWRAASTSELLQGPGIVVPAVPMGAFRRVLEALRRELRAEHTLMDVCSVKHEAQNAMRELCGMEIPWVATHPLFGPLSIALGERPLRAVVCSDTPHEGALARA